MTDQQHTDPEPDPLAASLTLQSAVDQLVQPAVVELDRDIPLPGTTAYQLAADDTALEEDLWVALHAAAAARDRAATTTAYVGLQQLDRRRASRTMPGAHLPSLLQQLQDEIPNSTNNRSGAGSGTARSPLAVAALDLVTEIATTAGFRAGAGSPGLTAQVRAWIARVAVDETQVIAAAERASTWPDRARAILDPPKRWTLPGACPECGARTAHVDEGGDRVRRPTIELDRQNLKAWCLSCTRGRWEGETQLGQLAKVLEASQTGE